MEEVQRTGCVVGVWNFHGLSEVPSLPALTPVHQPKPPQTTSFGVNMEASLQSHDQLSHRPLVIDSTDLLSHPVSLWPSRYPTQEAPLTLEIADVAPQTASTPRPILCPVGQVCETDEGVRGEEVDCSHRCGQKGRRGNFP